MSQTPSAKTSFFLHTLFFLIVASSTLNNWSLAEYALNGNWDPYYFQNQSYISLVPNWQKLLKDLFAFLLLITSLWFPSTVPKLGLRENRGLTICYALCLICLGIAIIRSIASDFSITLIFSCLRPFIAVVAVFIFCHRHLHPYYLRWVFEFMNPLALLQVYYAFLQRQAGVNQNGIGWLSSGLARSVGTFVGPNTLGLFLALVFYLNLSVLPTHKSRFFILLLCAVAIFFSGSRTALLIIILLFLMKIYNQLSKDFQILRDKFVIKFFFFPLLLTLLIGAVSQINKLSNRGDSSSLNDGRVDVFKGYVEQSDTLSILFGKYLGFGSNLVLTLNKATDSNNESFLADSTLTSILTQFGILGVVVVFATIYILLNHSSEKIYYPINYSLNSQLLGNLSKDKPGFLIYFLNTTTTIIIFEFYACLPIIISLLFLLRFPEVIRLPSANFSVTRSNQRK